ncbi:winged helix-turn-helix domain-containing protein [Ideonella sp. DXS29W]|uniref:Winged helix-turn-helix domain-containing protein n=1 Tax=Ideonella lacteola TaxID=2984193 RepID=A0ABU9BV93_9BURK
MPPSSNAPRDPWLGGFTLGDWRVDVGGNRLQREGEVRALRHKAMELLVLLARHAGQTVSRDDIVQAVWAGNHFVAPKAINTAVWTIRQALGDDPDAPQYVETIAKKGYRLIAPVSLLAEPVESPPIDARSSATADAPSSRLDEEVKAAELPAEPGRAVAKLPASRRAAVWGAALFLLLAGGAVWVSISWRDDAPMSGAVTPAEKGPMVAAPTPVPLTMDPGVEYLGALSPDGRQLAFAWWRGRGVGELHLRRLDQPGASPQAVSPGHGDVSSVDWAPDGHRLAFTALQADGGCRLWLQGMSVEAGGDPPARELARCAPLMTPALAWSPDGRAIVFSAERDGAGGLFSIAPDGTGLQRLTTAPPAAMADHQPSWSPDGRRLAFMRQDPADGTRDIYEWQPGSEPVRLTRLKLQFAHGLTHSADGRDLIFSTTLQDTRVLQRWDRATGQVVPLGLEGSAPSRARDGSLVYALIRTHVSIARMAWGGAPVRIGQAVVSDRWPRPDSVGRRIAFVSRRTGAQELWLASADGAGAHAITSLSGLVEAPAWSAADDRLAFIGPCGPGRRVGLCVIRADGSGLQPLAADAAAYGEPAWHPRSADVWVASDRGGPWRLWRFPVDGGAPQMLETDQPPGRSVQWLADGSGFVYQPRGDRRLRWRAMSGPGAGREQPVDVAGPGEELVDWRLAGSSITALVRSDRDIWRRVDLRTGQRQMLASQALGGLPERARFELDGPDSVWVEVANSHVADLMRWR